MHNYYKIFPNKDEVMVQKNSTGIFDSTLAILSFYGNQINGYEYKGKIQGDSYIHNNNLIFSSDSVLYLKDL